MPRPSNRATIGPPVPELIPARPSLPRLREAAAGCRACPLWRNGTQTVFGEGAASARLMLVGEQPGDREDRAGHPFVGPAGAVLDRALEEAGIARRDAYVTNVVKHFKWRQGRGKRRLHQRPNADEVAACRPWLETELAVVKPSVLVCLGATASKALLGAGPSVTRDRGKPIESDLAANVTLTIHPSAVLRVRDDDERRRARKDLAADLRAAAALL